MMKSVLVIMMLAGLASSLKAQIPPDVAAKVAAIGRNVDPPGTAQMYAPLQRPAPLGILLRENVAYGPDEKDRFDLLQEPARKGEKRPIVIFVHGGAFRLDDKSRLPDGRPSPFYGNVLLWAVRNHMVGINMNYALAPAVTYPAVQRDIATVVAWARKHAAEFGGDPDRIVLWGHSAGTSHVATYLAHPEVYADIDGARAPVAAAILFSGVYNMGSDKGDHIYFGPVAGLKDRSANEGLVRSSVPLFLEVAELDPESLIAQYESLRRELSQAHRHAQFLLAKGHGHMSEIYSINTADEGITAPVLRFLRSELR
ncbi:MAG: alpha/beta hydrolase [Janthinobacterium lividum]